MELMTKTDILLMARKCAIQRDCNRYGLLKAGFYSRAFERCCEFFAMQKIDNQNLLDRYNVGRAKFAAKLNKRTSIIPIIRFWS